MGRELLRRDLGRVGLGVTGVALLSALGVKPGRAASAPHTAPAPGPFDGSSVRQLAQKMATEPYQAPNTSLPSAIAHMNYDDFRAVTYRPDQALWKADNLPFQVQFFPRGFLYPAKVDMFEVVDGKAAPVPYSPDIFTYDNPKLKVPDMLGYSGLRILTPINTPNVFDEFCVFLGASYFRAVAKGQVYGLSARGLAIGTGDPKGEEFARFSAFWLEKPTAGQNSLVVHALLDSQSVTGAFKFTITPGAETVFDVESSIFPRVDITEPGIATLTGMFYFDANNRNKVNDWRPAAHDSEGLSMWTGSGTQIWRPLNDPTALQFSAFSDANPHGFGLMQRKRSFFDYQDVALQYEKRPSLWIEPIGDWGQGAVDLVEIPSPNEVNDNIVSFWRPKDKLSAKGEYSFTYRMHWGWDNPQPTKLGRIVDTRIGNSDDHQGLEIVLDIVGDAVKTLAPDAKPHAQVSTSAGKIDAVVVEPNLATGGYRIMFTLNAGDAKLAELSCILMNDQTPLSETWLYRWTP
ncbi:glucan biosynthesis protein G [Acidisoma cellulosilytica]|uniref:Glucan biosynthesis protein G n=1 Tax=Acidisoma cellulosilyticum TaxID=2802395 RepID=A0A963Z191_9PROT|nr:glucan biosynthesis protein G [Acidisoma cellulosilyticum]MCB8881002.1 glucan biosynthesis protein G [Acidisoma cellulosilyticum]